MTERTDCGIAIAMLILGVASVWIWFEVDVVTVVCTVLVAVFALWWVVDYVRERRGLIPPSQPREPVLLSRRRLWFSFGGLAGVALVAVGLGLAILLTSDHLGAATPHDAHWTAGMMIVLGVVLGAIAVGSATTQLRRRQG